MPAPKSLHHGMSLFTTRGERKYLNAGERRRFLAALPCIEEPTERIFCEAIFWTGCRISEALGLEIARVDVDEAALVFRTLKKHGANKGRQFRCVPVPREFIRRLDRIHGIRRQQRLRGADVFVRLWCFGRQKGWRLIKAVMSRARVFGVRACARGLRHTFGVHAILCGVPETRLKEWLGHSSLETTAVYVSVIGTENRAIARRMWARD